MNFKNDNIKAKLVFDEKQIPVEIKYNSKYSLLIRFLNGFPFWDKQTFNSLIFRVNGDEIELGESKLMLEPNIDGYAGRLIFVNDVYDLKRLFYENKSIKLQSAFVNLPLILARKENIKTVFREYTSSLNYDLNVYKNIFDELDNEFKEESKDVKESVQEAVLSTEGKKFMEFLDEKLADLEEMVRKFSRDEHERHGFYFRKQLWNIILCSTMMRRTNLKPRGYAGDSEMMRLIYLNDYQGDSTFSKLMHKHPMEHPAAEAVRNRRNLIVEKLTNLNTADKKRVLSVACGPAFEMCDLITNKDDCRKYDFTLLDQDRAALYEAATFIGQIEKKLYEKVKVQFLNESVRTMLRAVNVNEKWGKYHFIYSLGLFDYLTPPVAKAVLSKLCQLLEPGGELLIGNFHPANPSRVYMEYWLDWVLYYRTEDEFYNLLDNNSKVEKFVFFEETKCQMFLQVKKII